jgi:O-succinylbenzoic acid--CoA ligase
VTEASTRVPCPLRAAAFRSPDAEALIGPGWVLSYRDLDGKVSAAEGRLEGLGVVAGTRVAVYLPNSADYIVLLLALIRSGAVACPVSTRLPAGGVGPLLRRAGCSALISGEGELAGAVDGVDMLDPEAIVAGDPGDGKAPESIEVPLGRPATVIFTSGSTGTPKAALHTFGNHYLNAAGSNENISLAPGDRWLHSLPLYHVGGLSILFRCLLAGAAIAMPEHGAPIGESVRGLRATHVSLVSTQLRRLLAEETDLSGLRAVLMGGGPIPPSLVDRTLARGVPVHTSYGLTEMASQVTTTPPGASAGELRTAGRALPHREVRVSGAGEIQVRGATLFAGYLRHGGTDLPLEDGGWFPTGDLGEIDASGNLTVLGRRDNLFVSGGENVRPEEIEDALSRLPGVDEAVVVPVPDPEFGARPVAFVRRSAGAGDLARALEAVLPRFKIPKTFHEWEGAGGMKPDRVALEERASRLHGDDVRPRKGG